MHCGDSSVKSHQFQWSISILVLEIFQVELFLKFFEKEQLNVAHDHRPPWGLKVSARDETAPAA